MFKETFNILCGNLKNLMVIFSWVSGINIVRKALRQPCMQIALNAGVEASVIVSKVEEGKGDMGYDALNNEFVNMIEKGIIDPTKVSSVFIGQD